MQAHETSWDVPMSAEGLTNVIVMPLCNLGNQERYLKTGRKKILLLFQESQK